LNIPSVVVHSVILAPLLGFIFVLLNYYYIFKIFKSSAIALTSAILIAFTADSTLLPFYFDNSEQIKNLIHVAIFSLHLSTGQSLGWVLFVPTIASVFLVFQSDNVSSKIVAGLFVGLLFQTHSLTFINALMVIAFFLVGLSLSHNIRQKYIGRAIFLLLLSAAIIGFFWGEFN
jgi:hypothetical protein